MTQEEIVDLWLKGADDAWVTTQSLFESKRYHHSLFFAQLYLEKLLKALTYQLKNDHPLSTHNLVLLNQKLDISVTEIQEDQLREISAFNITARYDDHKQELYRKATPEFTKNWINITQTLADYYKEYLKK